MGPVRWHTNWAGRLTKQNGDFFEGAFIDGRPSGPGYGQFKKLLTYGGVYKGEVRDWKANGRGKHTGQGNEYVREGDFVDGFMVNGTIKHKGGQDS